MAVDLSAEEQRRLEHLVVLFEREEALLQLNQEEDGAWHAFVRRAGSEPAEAHSRCAPGHLLRPRRWLG